MDILNRIKRLVLRRQVIITAKAEFEMIVDDLTEDEVFESIVNARRIEKTIRSSNVRAIGREKLYVIKGRTFANIEVYTKGKLTKDDELETFYILISSKRSI
jgi:hypothetical protein